MDSIKISVIIPTHNREQYFYECISSICKQTLNNYVYEVIIIANGCTHEYVDKIKIYLENNCKGIKYRYVYTDVKGASNARNIGLKMAKGEYITFIDDDDWVSENYLQCLLEKATEDTIVQANVISFSDEHKQLPHFVTNAYQHCKDDNGCGIIKGRSFLSLACCKLIHRNIIRNTKFDVRFIIGEDALFMFEISNNIKRIMLTAEDTVYYVRHNTSSACRKPYSYSFKLQLAINTISRYSSIYAKDIQNYSFILYLTRIAATIKRNVF